MDRPTTVRRGKDRRPGEAVLLHAIRSGGVQKVLVWSIDRVSRSLVELVGFFETCRMAGSGPALAVTSAAWSPPPPVVAALVATRPSQANPGGSGFRTLLIGLELHAPEAGALC